MKTGLILFLYWNIKIHHEVTKKTIVSYRMRNAILWKLHLYAKLFASLCANSSPKKNHLCIMSRMCSYKSRDPTGISSLFYMLKCCFRTIIFAQSRRMQPSIFCEQDAFAHRTWFQFTEDSLFSGPEFMFRIGLSKYFNCTVNCKCLSNCMRNGWL